MLSLPSSPVKIREKFVSANPKCHESVSGSRIGKGTHLTLRDSGSEKICAHRTTHEIEGGGNIRGPRPQIKMGVEVFGGGA